MSAVMACMRQPRYLLVLMVAGACGMLCFGGCSSIGGLTARGGQRLGAHVRGRASQAVVPPQQLRMSRRGVLSSFVGGIPLAAVGRTAGAAPSTSCPSDSKNEDKDCQKGKDFGSCGNACCAIDLPVSKPPKKVYEEIRRHLQSGGRDKSYGYVTGPDASGNNPIDQLPEGVPNSNRYIFQGTHKTPKNGYVDVLNFAIREDEDDSGSIVRMFSSSGVHGALGDNGQNYKSLVALVEGVGYDKSKIIPIYGCGQLGKCGEDEDIVEEVAEEVAFAVAEEVVGGALSGLKGR